LRDNAIASLISLAKSDTALLLEMNGKHNIREIFNHAQVLRDAGDA